MPNVGHKWTDEEERDAVSLDWPAFNARYPGITRDAYRIRRQSLARVQKTPGCRVCNFIRRFHRHA